jgi:hypothetical protein
MVNNSHEDLLRLMRAQNEAEEGKAFKQWQADLLGQPPDLKLQPEDGFEVDIELQPLRWLWRGVELVESRKVTWRGQLAGGIEGSEISSYLPYAVFQMATEVFVKGMWLCQFENCRTLTHSSYIDRDTREKYLTKLGTNGLGHDLIKIINEVRKIPKFAEDAASLSFLDLIERIVRLHYFPPYRADRSRNWAYARYPKRVYNDTTQQAKAEGLTDYPPAKWIAKLFRGMEGDVDRIWSLRAGLSEKLKRKLS